MCLHNGNTRLYIYAHTNEYVWVYVFMCICRIIVIGAQADSSDKINLDPNLPSIDRSCNQTIVSTECFRSLIIPTLILTTDRVLFNI